MPMHFFEKARESAVWIDNAASNSSNSSAAASKTVWTVGFTPEEGGFLSFRDAKGNHIIPDWRSAKKVERKLLREAFDLLRRSSGEFRWDGERDALSLAEHPHLLDDALAIVMNCSDGREGKTALLVDTEGRQLQMAENQAKVVVSLVGKKTLTAAVSLRTGDRQIKDPRFLSPRHALDATTGIVYPISSLGLDFALLHWVGSTMLRTQAPKFLSLLYSRLDEENSWILDFEDREVRRADSVQPRLAFCIEKVDRHSALTFRLLELLPGREPGFMEDYLAHQAVWVEEHSVIIREVIRADEVLARKEVDSCVRSAQKIVGLTRSQGVLKEGGRILLEDTVAREFLRSGLPKIMQHMPIYGVGHLTGYKIRPVQPKVSVALGMKSEEWIQASGTMEIDGQEFDLMAALAEYRRNSFILLADGVHGIVPDELMRKLDRMFDEPNDSDESARVNFFDLPLMDEWLGGDAEAEPLTRGVFAGFNSIEDIPLPKLKLKADLRPYQLYGVRWLKYLHDNKLGGCLADDMGLGKTLQALAMLSMAHPPATTSSKAKSKKAVKLRRCSLVVMPRSLLFNWAAEIHRFCPQLTHYTFHGENRDLDQAMGCDLILSTYSMVRNNIEDFCKRDFYYVVLDESQAIKNSASQTARSVFMLKAERRLALSGTPVENHLGELHSLFRFLEPALFGSLDRFNRRYATPIQKEGDCDAATELRRKIHPFVLRRLKREVLKELPDKTEQVLWVEMGVNQRKLYERRRRQFHEALKNQIAEEGLPKAQFFIFQALSELRQLASVPEAHTEGEVVCPKRELLLENIQDCAANGRKALVFCNFLAAVEWVGHDLEREGIGHVVLTGATRDRQSLVERFQTDPDISVFVMTLKTGGVGLNLTAADTVFLYDPWWNKAAENQAVDRAHRIGQTSKVTSYKLIARDSIEERILTLQERKSQLFDAVISSDGAVLKSLSEDDIDFILG